ncbi:MFS transporter [Streptomyces sp. NPDC050619]|uniref:MFS transporter n=1 Tax=Streptomyces sp. NPDC050619 TaxID=3157214 RepID=UPI00342B892A
MVRAFAPQIVAGGGGAILNILSGLSWVSFPEAGAYCADKSAQWGLSGSVVMVASNPLPALAATANSIIWLIIHTRRRPDGYVPMTTIRSARFQTATCLTLALSAGYFTLLFVIPQLLITRAHWTKDAAATGQLVAMVLASLTTLAFTSIAARFSRTNVRIVLAAAGTAAALAAVLASAPVLLLAGIFLALFAATSANATQVIAATASVPEQDKPTAIGLFTLLYLLGGAIGPALASALVL